MASKSGIIKVALKEDAILTSPRFNKGTAFTSRERKQFGLLGRLPYQVSTLDQQCDRAYQQVIIH
jgi:malate dehydrogenase (oxaloacetate-decarboxylating)